MVYNIDKYKTRKKGEKMKPTNMENGKVVVNLPLEVKRKLYEKAEERGLILTNLILQILWEWTQKEAS